MLQRELQKHQWKAFFRHPMLKRNVGVRIFMLFIFGILGIQLFSLSFLLDSILLEVGNYSLAIYTFNSFILYLFLFDFTVKYVFKQNQSMQIMPYLTLPISRNRLFNFLLVKEFSNIWNLYLPILIIPFALKSIIPYYSFGTAILYILFLYLICVNNSLLVNVFNNLLKRNSWFFFVPIIIIAAITGIPFISSIDWGVYTVKLGEYLLQNNIIVWFTQVIVLVSLWLINLRLMKYGLYRELEGKKTEKAIAFSRFSFLDRLGEIGEFINLELKMIIRSKRLRQQLLSVAFMFVYYFLMIYSDRSVFHSFFMLSFFTMFVIGSLGLILSQYMFTTESSFFDGLMSRNHSLLNMIKGKYILYSSYALLVTCFLMIPVFQGKLDFLLTISILFYTTGFLFFLMFQNAVYNKSYFDLFDGGMFNWKGTSGNMLVVTMLGMFIPIILVSIIKAVFSQTIACYFMLITGLLFTLTANYWIKWTYSRFLKRRYKNMEGFRSNA